MATELSVCRCERSPRLTERASAQCDKRLPLNFHSLDLPTDLAWSFAPCLAASVGLLRATNVSGSSLYWCVPRRPKRIRQPPLTAQPAHDANEQRTTALADCSISPGLFEERHGLEHQALRAPLGNSPITPQTLGVASGGHDLVGHPLATVDRAPRKPLGIQECPDRLPSPGDTIPLLHKGILNCINGIYLFLFIFLLG